MGASQQLDSNQRRAGRTAPTTVTAKMLPAAPLLSCPAPTGGDRRDLKDLGALRKNASLYRELDVGETSPQSITGQWALRPNLNNLRAGRGALVVTNLISNVMDMSRDVENLYVSPLICYGLEPMPILVNVERDRVPT